MNTKEITVTSKNQVTIPAEYVRKLGLAKNRVLKASIKGDTIFLTAEPALSTQMQKYWDKHRAAKPLDDAALKRAIRTSAAKRSK
jgi:bifunctional DNA-binding transcriptional regulator/antitoxin component of YhaV-PrlF toxin-antitoxin module